MPRSSIKKAREEQEFQDALTEAAVSEIVKSDKGDYQKLRKAAKLFLDQVQMTSDLYEDAIKQRKAADKIREMYSNMRDEETYTQKILGYQHSFENSLNNFLGRKIYLTYVKDDGSFNFYDDFNIGKLYEQATKNDGRGNLSASKMFDANDLQANINQTIQQSTERRREVYVTALARYRNKKDDKVRNPISNRNYPDEKTFYWQQRKSLLDHTERIMNEGLIAEAYAGAVINESDDIDGINREKVEDSLHNLWHSHIKGKKDSIGAAIKGDVTYRHNGDIQFAVKKGSFSTAKVGQYVNLALNIMQLKLLTPEELQKNFKQMTKITKASLQFIESEKARIEAEITEMA